MYMNKKNYINQIQIYDKIKITRMNINRLTCSFRFKNIK